MFFVYGARSVNISSVAIHHCVYNFIFIIVLILGGLIVYIESSIYCQAFAKRAALPFFLLFTSCLPYYFRAFYSDGQSNVYLFSNEFKSL